jgi:ribosome-associated toxin RatA of RatAB toxin-antitoxin module
MQGPPLVVTQECLWKFLVFKGMFRLVAQVTEHRDEGIVDFNLVKSKFMRQFRGRWTVSSEGENMCKVVYNLQIAPIVSPPPAFAHYTSKIFAKQARTVMEDLDRAIRRGKS